MSGNPGEQRFGWGYRLLAYVSVGLAFLGIMLPGLPTVPFLLLAAWAAGRGSARLHAWLHEHRHFGPPLRHWQEGRAVPARAKWTAVLLLVASWTLLNWGAEGLLLPALTALGFGAIALFLVTRPTAPEAARETVRE